MKYTAKELEGLRRYQIESGSKEKNLDKAMKEYRVAVAIMKVLKPFRKPNQIKILKCASIMADVDVGDL